MRERFSRTVNSKPQRSFARESNAVLNQPDTISLSVPSICQPVKERQDYSGWIYFVEKADSWFPVISNGLKTREHNVPSGEAEAK